MAAPKLKKFPNKQAHLSSMSMEERKQLECHKRGVYFSRMLSKIVDVSFKYYSIRWDHSTAKQMHSKYMIVDNKTVYTGSYNWSNNAETSSLENVAIY